MTNDPAPSDELLRPSEVAELLNVSTSSVFRWIRRGELVAIRIGTEPSAPLRVPLSALVARLYPARPLPEGPDA